MTSKERIFIDSDVIISSLISKRGAAYLLLEQQQAKYFITDKSRSELVSVAKRLDIDRKRLIKTIHNRLSVRKLPGNLLKIKQEYSSLVLDENDAHIVAGADISKSSFLITYNHKHYKIEKIKRELSIIIYTPAQLLQYFRSQNKS